MRKAGKIKVRYILLKVKENNAESNREKDQHNSSESVLHFHSNAIFLGVFLLPDRLREKKNEHDETWLMADGRLEASKENFE